MERDISAAGTGAPRDEIHEMCRKAVAMLSLAWEAFRKQDTGPLQPAEKLGREIHQQEKALAESAARNPELFFVPMHLERIGDNIESLVGAIRTMVREGIPFTERGMREVNALFEKALELLGCVRDAVSTGNAVLIRHILAEGTRLQAMADEYALSHQQRLIEGVCMPKASSVYLAILDYLKGIESHSRQVAEKLGAAAAS